MYWDPYTPLYPRLYVRFTFSLIDVKRLLDNLSGGYHRNSKHCKRVSFTLFLKQFDRFKIVFTFGCLMLYSCPDYVNLPLNCQFVTVPGDCCKKVECTGGQGSFVGSSLTPGLIGSQPIPSKQMIPSPLPGQPTPAPGQIPQLIPSKVGKYCEKAINLYSTLHKVELCIKSIDF